MPFGSGHFATQRFEERLELSGDRKVVHWRTEHDGVRPAYHLDDRVGIVRDHALPKFLAGVAAGAKPDLLVLEPDDLGLIVSFPRPTGRLRQIAKLSARPALRF